jgi:hypothetical protein
MRGLRRSIRRNDVFRWVDDYLRAAAARDLAAFSRPGSDAESALAEQLPV